ncbi:MAG: nitrilase [Thermoanaerobacteraceae bacterium]|nr:nitrilase [Thermoanaerobacteraceae bacterium]
MKPLGIAVVQMQAKVMRVEENLAKIETYSRIAQKKNVNIICFPELSITGYSRERARQMAEPVPGQSSTAISGLAQQLGMTILAGLVEENRSGKPFITHIVAYPDGKIHKYRKTHLGQYEKEYFSQGDRLPVFKGDGVVFGVQLCWEMHFPEISTILALNGCEIIFAPHASPVAGKARRLVWQKYLNARAYDNSVYVAACNLVGYDGEKQTFGGGSVIIDPKGNVITECYNDREIMLVAHLDPRRFNAIRTKRKETMKNSFYLSARRPELYQDLLKG